MPIPLGIQPIPLNLPAQPLSATLDSVAQSSHTKLIYADATVKGLRAAPVKGKYTARQALDIALGKTGLDYKVVDKTLIAVTGKSAPAAATPTSAITLKPMTVVGEAVQDPNDPYNQSYIVTDSTVATKTDTPIMQTPMSVQVVTQQVMRDQQAVTLDQALRNVPGAVSGAQGRFFLRGFQTYNVYRNFFLNQSLWFQPEDLGNVERVEVLKGPASILYPKRISWAFQNPVRPEFVEG